MIKAQYTNIDRTQLKEHLSELIRIPSVCGNEIPGMPFGKNINDALMYVLDLAEKMGLEVNNLNGYAGEIVARKNQKKTQFTIGVLCHVDVVDGGEGWDTNPFEPVIKNGKLFGRGSIDDKGPLLASLYAMAELKNADLIPEGKAIKMIIGTNEEEDWKCIDYYVENVDMLPDYSIVPDANFPLINCEKGLLNYNWIYDINEDISLVSLTGGSARNVVPSKASCQIKITDKSVLDTIISLSKKHPNITAKSKDNSMIIIDAHGKSAHCMSPEKGINSISILLDFLYVINKENRIFGYDFSTFLENYNLFIGDDYFGGKLGIDMEDDESGKLTINIGNISYEHSRILIEIDVRYPASFSFEDVENIIKDSSGKMKMTYEFITHIDSIYHSKDSELVQTLMKAYIKITRDNSSEPLAIGGATYARALPNAVAFGPLFPNEEELAHEANEFINLENLNKSIDIYAEALKDLLQLV